MEQKLGLRARSLILEFRLFDIFPNLIATNFQIWRAKELDSIQSSTVVVDINLSLYSVWR